jgi:hypothetical protein
MAVVSSARCSSIGGRFPQKLSIFEACFDANLVVFGVEIFGVGRSLRGKGTGCAIDQN